MAAFNWNISGTSNSYTISSVDDSSIPFSKVPLKLISQGKDSEHYMFQLSFDKQVNLTSSLTNDGSDTTCFYNSTTFQAYLYTKMASSYPPKGISPNSEASYDAWPYAVRVEEVVGGGDNVPNCYKMVDGQIGNQIESDSLKPQDAGSLCDCLYMNWTP